MSDKFNGGPAFPIPLNPGETFKEMGPADGISVRDYFAAKALPAVIAAYIDANGPCLGTDHITLNCAAHAYRFADAMLKKRKANER